MFRCEFSNFLGCSLDVKWSFEKTLRMMAAIKGWRMMGSVVPQVILVSPAEKDN